MICNKKVMYKTSSSTIQPAFILVLTTCFHGIFQLTDDPAPTVFFGSATNNSLKFSIAELSSSDSINGKESLQAVILRFSVEFESAEDTRTVVLFRGS